jgi:hypothetical protein
MPSPKAARPAVDKSNRGPRAIFSARQQKKDRQATPTDFVFQALAVFDGQTCIGHLMPRGKLGTAAFDADDRLLGIFPNQKSAADAVSRAGAPCRP